VQKSAKSKKGGALKEQGKNSFSGPARGFDRKVDRERIPRKNGLTHQWWRPSCEEGSQGEVRKPRTEGGGLSGGLLKVCHLGTFKRKAIYKTILPREKGLVRHGRGESRKESGPCGQKSYWGKEDSCSKNLTRRVPRKGKTRPAPNGENMKGWTSRNSGAKRGGLLSNCHENKALKTRSSK